jgi:hypothetical protein
LKRWMCILYRNQGDMSSLKNQPNAYNRLEGICLFIYPFPSASFLGVVYFCRYSMLINT